MEKVFYVAARLFYTAWFGFIAYVGIEAGVAQAMAWVVATGVLPLMVYGTAE